MAVVQSGILQVMLAGKPSMASMAQTPSDMAAQCCCLVWGAVCMQVPLLMALDYYYFWNQLAVFCSMSWALCARGGNSARVPV